MNIRVIFVAAIVLFSAAVKGEAEERVFITLSEQGSYYFKMIGSADTGRGICYRVSATDQDEIMWRTEGWYGERLLLAADGRTLISGQDDAIYLYRDGDLVRSWTAADLRMRQIDFDRERSGFDLDSNRFQLVTLFGEVRLLSMSALPAPVETPVDLVEVIDLSREAPVVPQTAISTPAVKPLPTPAPQPAEVRQPTAQSEPPAKAAPAAPVTGMDTGRPVITPADKTFRCAVKAISRGSGKERSVVQQGPSPEVAADRALAYCEGMVGTGSKRPTGTCSLASCVEVIRP